MQVHEVVSLVALDVQLAENSEIPRQEHAEGTGSCAQDVAHYEMRLAHYGIHRNEWKR